MSAPSVGEGTSPRFGHLSERNLSVKNPFCSVQPSERSARSVNFAAPGPEGRPFEGSVNKVGLDVEDAPNRVDYLRRTAELLSVFYGLTLVLVGDAQA